MARRAADSFSSAFPGAAEAEVAACFVPGRLEFLGKHTDYAGGRSLLGAVNRGFTCIAARNGTNHVRLVEADPRFAPAEFALAPNLESAEGEWRHYPMTMVKRLVANFPELFLEKDAGVDIAFGCDLPVAAGLSGSSALMIMTFFALALPNRLMESERFRTNVQDRIDLATYLACAENGQTFRELPGGAGVGTFGGSEDHTAILTARANRLAMYRFCPTTHEIDIPLPDSCSIVVAYSGLRAEKTRAVKALFNALSNRARWAVRRYNEHWSAAHHCLRDLAGAELEKVQIALATGDKEDLLSRFLQFRRESEELIPEAARALAAGDMECLGRVVDESHRLSRECLRNILPEIDWLQRCARELGAFAASGFGAGFGGSVYALVEKSAAARFADAWRDAYQAQWPAVASHAEYFVTSLSNGAGELY